MLMLIARHFRPRRGKVPIFKDRDLNKLTMPVLLVVGGRDVLLDSKESAKRLRNAATNPTIRLLPDAGHVIGGQEEVVEEFLLDHSERLRAAV
jgi:pimeloyl-ACP methyl ester carboxylesterase